MHSYVRISLLLLVKLALCVLGDNPCVYIGTQGIINLTLVGDSHGEPAFKDYGQSGMPDYYRYSYNPCYSFNELNCINSAGCQVAKDKSYSLTIGTQNSTSWIVSASGAASLVYKAGPKTMIVDLQCVDGPNQLIVNGEKTINEYHMTLQSKCACWNGCLPPKPVSNACFYIHPQLGTINLTSIGKTNGKPRFKDIKSTLLSSSLWSYNPCFQFTEYNCQNAAACQIDRKSKLANIIGEQDNVQWENIYTNPTIIYHTANRQRSLSVELICNDNKDASNDLEVIGEISGNEFYMKLRSKCACWNGCPSNKPSSSKFPLIVCGIGIIAIIFFVSLISCLIWSKPHSTLTRITKRYIIDEKAPILINDAKLIKH